MKSRVKYRYRQKDRIRQKEKRSTPEWREYRRGVMKRYNEKLKEMKVELWKDDDLNNVEFLLLKMDE